MNDFAIVTDSGCDMPADLADELELTVEPLSVLFREKEYANYLDERELKLDMFFDALRAGEDAKTSAVNTDQFISAMEPFLAAGKDILYIGFSSGLSNTYNAGVMAAEELREKYPDRKIYTVDTLCASLGQGLIVYLAVMEKRKGKTIEEVRDYAMEKSPRVSHWVTVEDLHFLQRGGRISKTVAAIGSMLNIKPIIHVNGAGKLVNIAKARGRQASLQYLVTEYEKTALDKSKWPVFIAHGGCRKDAQKVADMIAEKCGVTEFVINSLGPVIGAHAGPGTVALFFLGSGRKE